MIFPVSRITTSLLAQPRPGAVDEYPSGESFDHPHLRGAIAPVESGVILSVTPLRGGVTDEQGHGGKHFGNLQ